MKGFSVILCAGAAAAVNLATPVIGSSGSLDPISAAALLNGSQNSALNLGGLDLSSLDLGGGLNLGSIDLSNQNDIVNAILEMMALLCLQSSFDVNSLLNLGNNDDLELFLELAQLMQLEQLGFVNVGGIQSLINSGLVLNNFFNLGAFKREVAEAKKTMKRSKLHRPRTPLSKRQSCQAGAVAPDGSVATAVVTTVVPAATEAAAAPAVPAVVSAAPAVVSAAPEVAAPAPAVAAPAPAVATPEVAPAAAPAAPAGGENLSDFTR